MTNIILSVIGTEKENVAEVSLAQNGNVSFTWGGVNGHGFNESANLASGQYNASFKTSKGHHNDEDITITGLSGTLTVEDDDDDYDIRYTQARDDETVT